MASDTQFKELVGFFKRAQHLWGRCPCCGDLFRLSEAVISYGSEPPKDWLTRLQNQKKAVEQQKDKLDDWQGEVEGREYEVQAQQRELDRRAQNLVKEARGLAREMMKDDKKMKKLLTEARREAVQRSRSTLLGKLFERLAPFLQRFDHDPRDVRAIMDPVDYVVFDGLTINRRVERITFVEVKSGTSRTSPVQRSIFEAIREGRIGTAVWHVGDRGVPMEQQLLYASPKRRALPPAH